MAAKWRKNHFPSGFPDHYGYTFVGWYSEKALDTKVKDVTLDEDTTVYAKWTKSGDEAAEDTGTEEKTDKKTDESKTVDVSNVFNTKEHNAYAFGYDDGKVHPEDTLTRAEAMAIINRVLNRGVDANGLMAAVKQWADNTTNAWYYYDVPEATNGHFYTGSCPSEIWTGLQNSAE